MGSYKYEVRNADGEVSAGVLQASSISEASTLAQDYGTYVLNVAPIAGLAQAGTILGKMREVKVEFGPGLKDVMSFTKQLAVMIKSGINIRSAISGIVLVAAIFKRVM